MKKNNWLTIIIPCKNEEKYIYNTLESISKQVNVEINTVKIYVADANSTDKTIKKINQAKQDFNLNLEIIPGGSVSVGRNNGAKLATTPFILFMDADATLDNPMTLSYSAWHSLSGDRLITCKLKSTSKDIMSKLFFSSFNILQKFFFTKPFSTGVYFFTSRETFNELGGFDETVTQSEDYLLSRKYKRSQFHIMNMYVGQDNRRFKKMGYFGFLKFLLLNYINRNNINHFRKDFNYWS
jgi:glycosyltransferase involved in cell wall biosynthesis